MKRLSLVLWTLVVICCPSERVWSDMGGASVARTAVSPGGNLLVRINTVPDSSRTSGRHELAFYEFDSAKDSYVRKSGFPLKQIFPQMIYVSDFGDVVMVRLQEFDSIQLYSNRGDLRKSWNLREFLSKREMKACAQTGSTLQWLEEAAFQKRRFSFRGPSRVIRALSPSFTVMRGANPTIKFSASIDAENAKLARLR